MPDTDAATAGGAGMGVADVPWSSGAWTHEPEATIADGGDLLVTAKEASDAWRTTSYGFVHESEHALIAPMPRNAAVEVEFSADFTEQFDQAGVFLHASDSHWIKAGVEFVDGALQLGAVVTDPNSDWSVAPVADWSGRRILIRASREGDAVTIRAKVDDGDLRLVRVVPLGPGLDIQAGPFVCAPTRSGLQVRFHSWRFTAPDAQLH